MTVIRIAEDFSKFPGGRYPEDGDGNGTTFREQFLIPVLKQGHIAKIILDGARGYPSSFLEEAFGGLVRAGYSKEQIEELLILEANEPKFSRFLDLIKDHIAAASANVKK